MKHYAGRYLPEESAAWLGRQLENYAQHRSGFWFVTEKATSESVGLVGITMRSVDGIHRPEVGYLIHNSFWRRGFATEAAIATRDYAFNQLKFKEVISLIRPENTPAQGVAVKLGMTPEKQTVFNGAEYVVYSISRGALFRTG
jgi:RimJ/RimL family protein N-acetyltransferase